MTAEDKKKWFLLTLIIVLTGALIIIFRMKDLGNFVSEQHRNLAGFYTSNLRPLIARISLTNDDIFNFAFHRRLPLNNEKDKFLVLGDEQGGAGYFEFVENLPDESEDLEDFVNTLELNKDQKALVDSILDSYKGKIEEQILVNDKNTLAINSGLWNLNRAILADILSYTSKVNKIKLNDFASLNQEILNDASLQDKIKHVKTIKDRNYIFVTPDSVFDIDYNFDMQKYEAEMAKLDKDLSKFEKEEEALNFKIKFDKEYIKNTKKGRNDFNIHVQPNLVKIQIPKSIDIPVTLPHFDFEINEIRRDVAEIKKAPKPPKKNDKISFSFNVGGTDDESFELNFNLPDIDSLVEANLKVLDSLNVDLNINLDDIESLEREGIDHQKMDSITEQLTKITNKLKEHPEKAKDLQKEIDRLNRELNKLYSNKPGKSK